MHVAIIGGGPAGLRAAECAAGAGARVTILEARPSVGRKLLVAGRGGLNLTHAEEFARFVARYRGPDQPAGFWERVIGAFSPSDLRQWAAGLGIETFVQRTGRVYPMEMKAAPLLRRWVSRLRESGVTISTSHRWVGLVPGRPHELVFDTPSRPSRCHADSVVLALGGASWSLTGSDGRWVSTLREHGIAVSPLQPANCGWETPWPPEVLAIAEGRPLKNLRVSAGEGTVLGELMVTAYGLEGGAIYQLGATLREMEAPLLRIDFKPTSSTDDLLRRMKSVKRDFPAACAERWKLSPAAHAIVCHGLPPETPPEDLARRVKDFPVPLTRPRPIDEAISSAGGVGWPELDENLMLRKLPGIFVAGEMIDWEAPTGGYLMQGCFATGTLAGTAAARYGT